MMDNNTHDDRDGGETQDDSGSAHERIDLELPEGVGTFGDESDMQAALREAEERVLRVQAELENFRRRVRREMDDERKFANQGLLSDLLPVADNIERAIEAANKSDDGGGLLAGFRLVGQQLIDVFKKYHCQRIDAANQVFDPSRHQAIAQQPSADVPAGTVVLVAQDGYALHERVIRPAQVIVSKEVGE